MKFSAIQQGTRARQRAELPLGGAKLDPATGKWTGSVIAVDLRPLLPEEIADAQAAATAYAKKKGVDAEVGNPTFDIAVAIHTVHAAAMDPDHPSGDVPFFDVAPEALFRAEGVGLDALVYLYERQLLWQAESSPRPGFVTPEELQGQIERMGGGADEITFFYARLQPAARLICLHTMAGLLRSSLKPSSGSGTVSSSVTGSKFAKRSAGKAARGAASARTRR